MGLQASHPMRLRSPVFATLCLAAVISSPAAEVSVSDPESARKAVLAAKPGDVIVLAAGEWKDADLRLDGEGTAERPVTIRAEKPGETIFTGASRLRLGGSHLVVSGLFLLNLSGSEADWLEFRIDSKRRARFCRVTDCAFLEDAKFTAKEKENRWIGIYGEGNRFDHCTIQGKKNRGATVVVWLGEQDPGRHRIDANFFAGRPRLGKNGGETIRVGDSRTSMMRAGCLVEGNYFHRCDGETECISNKSCGNTYRGNWFVETQGTLTLRHGNGCLVEGNRFAGLNRGETGGIRLIGEGHRVIGNVLFGLRGEGFRGAICLVNGIPGSPENGYFQVKDAVIEGNTVFDCKDCLVIGFNDEEEATLAPTGVRFAGNSILAGPGQHAVRVVKEASETSWVNNTVRGSVEGMIPVPGFSGGPEGAPVLPESPDPSAFGAGWMRAAAGAP
jgi:poly(beta-D-mannuronate) lyase